ncbi:hypothetical protein [Actinokineospora sp. NBRC 105648]|uniref:hypothetical protein n=1 Tax=Actinokineospora sp. NBRC 105648 TaxID=3032206 RepID=UPI0024A47E81|nr:hypothetical protein [Actinokineospora sp. NBRC 105648]GLZ41234.1 hypothetical protein Acsp05_48580 [Actinokineospora sp. NBRC 105648]
MSKVTQREAAAVEPPVEGPAIEDLATARALTSIRLPLIGLPFAVLLFGVPAVWLIAAGGGWIGIAILTVAALAFLVTLVLAVLISGRWIGPATRLLRTSPWRPATVKVFRPTRGLPKARLLARFPDGSTLNLLAPALPWAAQQVLARTGKIWLVGPDDKGWTAIRSTGLALPLGQARVSTAEFTSAYEISVEQPAPVRASLASADAVLARVIAAPRKRARTDLVAPALLTIFAGFIVVDLLRRGIRADQVWLSIGVFVGTLAILALLGWRIHRMLHWSKIDRLLAAGPWTQVPVDLPAPTRVTRKTVTGQATLPDGRVVPVVLPRAGSSLRTNVAATGVLWVAGKPEAGLTAAAGLPGYPFLNLAHFGE